ncbi:LacI family DNA-binding transcriptional regulator [Gilliamella sp. CG16]|uniref:LacI family DNA-binding transcriptional regulator n=1 Tax=Gilliamella sp. CG16 TaxID=3351503 RepID=UPI0039879150
MNKVTLAVIAQKANLSIASVSRVLNTPNLTSALTQSRVYKAIEELGIDTPFNTKPYHVECETQKILIIDNQLFSQSLINIGLESGLKEAGYQFFYLRFAYSSPNDIHHLIRYATQNIFDGIMIINDAPYLDILKNYKSTLPPIILVNHFSLDFNCVYFDHLTIAYNITQYLVHQIHKKIAVIINDSHKMSSTLFLQGYQQALLRSNIKFDPNYLIHHCFSYEQGRSAIKKLIESNKPPTAIICSDNIHLNYLDEQYYDQKNSQHPFAAVLGILHQVNQSKDQLTTPFAITYINHSKDRQYNELDQLSRIYKPLSKMGRKSARLLCDILKQKTASTLQYHLVETESLFIN